MTALRYVIHDRARPVGANCYHVIRDAWVSADAATQWASTTRRVGRTLSTGPRPAADVAFRRAQARFGFDACESLCLCPMRDVAEWDAVTIGYAKWQAEKEGATA